jgi:hypothetical protein
LRSITTTLVDDHVSVHDCDSDSQVSSCSSLVLVPSLEVRPITEILQGIDEVDRTWGSSSDWFIDLRDGRQLRLQMDLRGLADDSQLVEAETTQKLIQWVSSHQNAIDGDDCDSD